MDISIVIVNYNVKYFLEQCLYSVIKACRNIEAEIFVVDNNSSDGSREYLEPKFREVHFLWNNTNAGFAKANNSVLKNVTGQRILFLNPDTIVPEDCLEKCISFFNQYKNCGALGVKMIDGAGKFLKESKRSLPLPLVSFFKMTGIATFFPRSQLFARYYAGHLPEDAINEIDVLPGAFFMADKNLVVKLGGFDEDFFMYGEDIDLSYRIQKGGYKNYYFPGTTIIHFKGESTQKKLVGYHRHFYGAMKMFIHKHFNNNAFLERLMLLAINIGRQVSIFKLRLVKSFRLKDMRHSVETIVIGNEYNLSAVSELCANAKPPLVIMKDISATEDIDQLISAETLLKLSKTHKTAFNILFCEGNLSFKNIIRYMAELKGKFQFLFHSDGSSSMVGSKNKNENGIFVSK